MKAINTVVILLQFGYTRKARDRKGHRRSGRVVLKFILPRQHIQNPLKEIQASHYIQNLVWFEPIPDRSSARRLSNLLFHLVLLILALPCICVLVRYQLLISKFYVLSSSSSCLTPFVWLHLYNTLKLFNNQIQTQIYRSLPSIRKKPACHMSYMIWHTPNL